MDKVTLYTIGCPQCKVLEKKLELAGIQYETCTDVDKMKEKGIKSAPVLEVNNDLYNFVEAAKWIRDGGNK